MTRGCSTRRDSGAPTCRPATAQIRVICARHGLGERTRDLFPASETLYCAPSPEKRLRSQPRQNRGCHSSGTFRRVRYSVPHSKTLHYLRAPLRNRTVDLLLTMDHQSVPVAVAYGLTSADTGSRERRRAPASLRQRHSAHEIAPWRCRSDGYQGALKVQVCGLGR